MSTTLQTIALTTVKAEARVDTRQLALQLGNKHQNTFELLKQYQPDFESFGKVLFETGASTDSKTGQSERYALLNEDQAYLLLTYSRNTVRARELKVRLVKSFGEARRAAVQHGAEYLPGYHELHDQIGMLAAGSNNERFVHMNINKLMNKVAGIGAGERKGAKLSTQTLLIVAQTIAANAARGAQDHREAYKLIKDAMSGLAALNVLGVAA